MQFTRRIRSLPWLLAAVTLLAAACAGPRQAAPAAPDAATAPAAPGAATAPAAPDAATAPAAPDATQPAPSGYPLTLVDDAGRTVSIAAAPERVVSIGPAITEILFAIGAGDRVVAVDDHSNYPDAAAALPRVGTMQSPALETIVSLSPDAVFISDLSAKSLPDLEQQGLTVVLLQPGSVAAIYQSIDQAGRITGRADAARALIAGMAGRIDGVARRVAGIPESRRVRVYHEVWHDPLITAGPGSFIDDLIRLAGGINIAGDAGSPWPAISLEAVIDRDPQVITTPFADQFQLLRDGARPGWEGISAVRSRQVFLVDQDLISRAGPRAAAAVETLARAFYPDAFDQ